MLHITRITLLIVMAMAISGCGGGSNPSTLNSPADPSAGVLVTPSSIGQVWEGTSVQFKAQVVGQSNQAVVWTVAEGSAGGSVDISGLYTAPSAAGTFHVVATSQADPRASGVASVEVVLPTVSIYPPAETLRIGGQRQFSGFVLASNPRVTWSLQEGAAAGSITADGLYTAPNTTGRFHVIATSVFNPDLSATAPVTIVTNGFTLSSDMDTARSGHTATLLLDGRVLVAGGTTDATHSAELFAPASSSFAATAGGMVQVRSGHCSAALPNGKVLIAGGGSFTNVLFKTAEVFDPATQSFTGTGDLNQARIGATATLLPSGKVLIAGGKDSTGSLLSTAELYDPASGSFSVTGNMQSPRAQQTATLLANGNVLLIGSSTDTASAEIYDPAAGLFTSTGSLNQARAHHTATLLPDGKVLVTGGTQKMEPGGGGAPAADVSLASAEIYNPVTGSFQPAGNLLIARDFHSATLLPNGTVLVAGGYSQGFDGDADPTVETMFSAELFNPATLDSTPAASLEAARAEHVATLLNNGQVLVTGGRYEVQELCCNPNPVITTLASAEIYQ